MKSSTYLLILLAALLILSACTRKDNLTGTNWSSLEAITFNDADAMISGYSYPADSLASIQAMRKALLVGRWNSTEARSILRFTDIPADSVISSYNSLMNVKLELVLSGSSEIETNPIKLQFYKVNTAYNSDPFQIAAEDLELITQSEYLVPATITALDTVSVNLPFDLLRQWQADADSSGLNIMIAAAEEGFGDGFVEIRLSTATNGSKLSWEYKETAEEEEYQSYKRYAAKNDYNLSYDDAEITPGVWRISNYRPQRMYIDMQPDLGMFKYENGDQMTESDLKKVSINKAEIVLHIKDTASLSNAFSYSFNALLIKNRPETPELIPTEDMYLPEFSTNIVNITLATADSAVVDITPIIQAYVSQKSFPDGTLIEPNGIILMSKYERNDFGEIEFWHPMDSGIPPEKMPYIRIKYTPPFL